MKKIILGIVIVLVVLVLVGMVAAHFFLDGAIKRGVEIVGPKLTKVEVKLDSVSLSLLSGSGQIKGLHVGNPEGYKSPQSIAVGSTTIALKPGSLLSDKTVINKIEVIAPEITFEGGLSGNNLSKLLDNIEESTGGKGTNAAAPQSKEASKKLQVDDFVITGAKVHVTLTDLAGSSGTVVIPEIHLTNLGQGPEGITAADLSKLVLQEIVKYATKAAAGAVTDLTKGATGLTKDLGNTAGGNLNKLGKGLGGLLKKETSTNATSTSTNR